MVGVGLVKAFGKQTRSVRDVVFTFRAKNKEVETLFFFKTCTVLTSSTRALAMLNGPCADGAYRQLSP